MGAYDVLGVVLGVLGILGLAPLLNTKLRSFLPARRMKYLDDALEETASLLHSVTEDRLLPDPFLVSQFEVRLSSYRKRAEACRVQVLAATTLMAQCVGVWTGLSREINETRESVISVLGDVATNSQKEREKRAADIDHPVQHPPAQEYIETFANQDAATSTSPVPTPLHDRTLWYPPSIPIPAPILGHSRNERLREHGLHTEPFRRRDSTSTSSSMAAISTYTYPVESAAPTCVSCKSTMSESGDVLVPVQTSSKDMAAGTEHEFPGGFAIDAVNAVQGTAGASMDNTLPNTVSIDADTLARMMYDLRVCMSSLQIIAQQSSVVGNLPQIPANRPSPSSSYDVDLEAGLDSPQQFTRMSQLQPVH